MWQVYATAFQRFIYDMGTIVQATKPIACEGTHRISTPARTIFPTSEIILEDWHVHQNIITHALTITNRWGCRYNIDDMKTHIKLLLSSCIVPYFYNVSQALESKYFGCKYVMTSPSPFLPPSNQLFGREKDSASESNAARDQEPPDLALSASGSSSAVGTSEISDVPQWLRTLFSS